LSLRVPALLFSLAFAVLLTTCVQAQTVVIDDAAPAESLTTAGVPQRDIMDVLKSWLFGVRIEPQLEGSRSGLEWSVLPTLSYNPVFGFAFGASATGAGRFGSGPKSRPSVISVSGNYSTQGQTQVLLRAETTSPSGDYLTKADFRYLDTQRSTWGLGPISEDQQEYPTEYDLVRTYATFYRRASGPVYVGLGYHLDDFSNIRDERAELGEMTPLSEYNGPGVTATRASGVSLNLLSDTRDSIVNPSKGYHVSGSFRTYMQSLGSDQNWQEFWVAAQMYPHLPRHSDNILAFWLYSWLTFGPGPYHNLPATGWDTYGRGARGYLQGRIQAANQLYVESEYRFGLTRDGLLGGVVFINATSSTDQLSQTFGRLDTAGGLGIRIKFNKYSRTNLALDHAWGRAGSQGWFMGMSEVF
jgi:hypothetical protein